MSGRREKGDFKPPPPSHELKKGRDLPLCWSQNLSFGFKGILQWRVMIIYFSSTCNNPAREFGWETAWLLILFPFGWFSHLFLTFTHYPAALISLSADLQTKTHGKEATCLFATVTAWFIQSFWGFITHAQGSLAWEIPCDFQRMNLKPFGASSYLLHTHFLQGQ